MTLRINNNIAAINSHRNLQKNDEAMNKTLEKLSSGLKINRAAEGPASLVISEQMRGQIAGYNQAMDNSETGISMIQTTEANLSEVNRLLVSMRQLAVHAANDGANDETMLAADQAEVSNALETINRISNQAQFGNKKLLDGSLAASGTTTGEDLQFVSSSLKTADSREAGLEILITQNAAKSDAVGSVALTPEVLAGGEKLTVIENGKMATYTTNADDTADTAIKNWMNEIRRGGLEVDVMIDAAGAIQIEHEQYGSEYGFQFSSSTAGVLSSKSGEIEVSNIGMDVKGTMNGESAIGNGQALTGITGANNVDGLTVRFLGQADLGANPEGEIVGKAFVSQNSVNFHVGANYGQTVGISIGSTRAETLGNNIENETGYRSLLDVDVRTFQGAQDALKLLDSAIIDISARRGVMGAFQKNTLESNLNNLRVATESLTSAESIIRDVDMAKEMANFTKNQIMTQSATAMLAQANQTPKNILSLLQ